MYLNRFYINVNKCKSSQINRKSQQSVVIKTSVGMKDKPVVSPELDKQIEECNVEYHFLQHSMASLLILIEEIRFAASTVFANPKSSNYVMTTINNANDSRNVYYSYTHNVIVRFFVES